MLNQDGLDLLIEKLLSIASGRSGRKQHRGSRSQVDREARELRESAHTQTLPQWMTWSFNRRSPALANFLFSLPVAISVN